MVTADEYELPLCVESTIKKLSDKMGIPTSTISYKKRYAEKYGYPSTCRKKAEYRIYAVEEIEDEQEERNGKS